MKTPTVWIYGQGDTRERPRSWITPRHLEALEATSEQFRRAGFEPRVIRRSLIESQQEAWDEMQTVEQGMEEGDVLCTLCTGWGLPGITEHAWNRLSDAISKEDLKVHIHCNLLPQFPGFVLGSALTQILAEQGVPFTKEIVLDWNKNQHVNNLEMLRKEGEILREYNDDGPGDVEVTNEHRKVAQEIDRRIRGGIYGGIGVSSMLMPQGYINRRALAELGMTAYDIGACEFLETADAVPISRAKNAMKFCLDKGLKIAPDVPEETFLRQMQYLIAMDTLRIRYNASCMAFQGQFDFTRKHPADDFATAAMNSRCRPESDGLAWIMATEKDFFATLTMRILQIATEVVYGVKGESVDFHDLRHLVEHPVGQVKKWLIVFLNSGALNFRALTGKDDSLKGVRAESQNLGYFPKGGAATAGEMVSLDKITYPENIIRVKEARTIEKFYTVARLISLGRNGFCLQAGKGDIVGITKEKRYEKYGDLDRPWPFGLFDPACDAWRIAYEFISNHVQGIPFYLLPYLKAFAELKHWEFKCLGN